MPDSYYLLTHRHGKPFLPRTLNNKAYRGDTAPFYIRSPKFSYQMMLAKGDGSYGKTINKLACQGPCPVIDDIGLAPMTDAERSDIPGVVEERHGNASTIVTSQLPV